jgi:hypothetical protein
MGNIQARSILIGMSFHCFKNSTVLQAIQINISSFAERPPSLTQKTADGKGCTFWEKALWCIFPIHACYKLPDEGSLYETSIKAGFPLRPYRTETYWSACADWKEVYKTTYFRVYSRIKIKSSSQVNFLAYYGSTNQSTFTKFWNLKTFLIRFGTGRLKWKVFWCFCHYLHGTDPVESTLTETLIKLYTIINLKLFILRCSLQGYGQRLSRRLPTGGGG